MKIAYPLLVVAMTSAAFGAGAATVVPVQPFDSIELKGGGHVTLTHGPTRQVRIVNGSTQFTHIHADDSEPRKLIIDACNADCPHHYDLNIEIVTPDINGVAISGGGSIESRGAFPNQHEIAAAVHGGGRIDIRSIDAADATAAVEGGGNISLRAADGLTAAVDGGGHIQYWGNPRVTEAINGGGRVNRGS